MGLRGVVARGIVGPPTEVARRMDLASGLFTRSAEEELEITRACLEARGGGGRVVVWPAPLNVTYVGQDLLRDSVELAREFGVGWHTHCSEGDIDPGIYLEAYGTRPAQWLAAEGLLGDDATLAHGIWFDDAEIELIGATRTGISYNPVSNEYIGNGVARLRDLRQAGASVGLGTDGIAVTGQDMFECMKQSVLLQRAHTGDPVASTVEEAMELATREGARYAGIDAGVLAPGRLADVAVVNLSNVHTRPVHRTVAALVYSARASDVEMTIVGGRVVYEGGRCVFVDEQAMMEEADARAAELVARAGMTALTSPWHRQRVRRRRGAVALRPGHVRTPAPTSDDGWVSERLEEIVRVSVPGSTAVDRHASDRRLQEGVGGRRHPVQASEQHDLAVEVVHLGAARVAQQALPRRAAGPGRCRRPGATAPSPPVGGPRTWRRRSTASPPRRSTPRPRRGPRRQRTGRIAPQVGARRLDGVARGS